MLETSCYIEKKSINSLKLLIISSCSWISVSWMTDSAVNVINVLKIIGALMSDQVLLSLVSTFCAFLNYIFGPSLCQDTGEDTL